MNFGYVIKRAWEIIWKFKILWIFGILASCGQATGSNAGNSGYRVSGQGSNVVTQFERFFNQIDPAVRALLILVGILIVLTLIVLAVLLGTLGRVGLIRGTIKAEQGAERLTFGELWREGLTYFWRVFGLNLLIGVIIFVVVLAVFLPAAILTGITSGLFLLCVLPLVCVFILALWAVTVIVEQANIALVVENLGIIEAIKHGWRVVWDNLGNMIVMSLILTLGVGIIGGFIIALPLLIVAAPLIAGYAAGTSVAIRNGWIGSGILFIIYLPFLLLFSGVLRAYTGSAWTLTYMRLTHKPSQEQIEPSTPPEITEIPPAQNP